MRFEEALRELREGNEIRRAEWVTKLVKIYESILFCYPSKESYYVDLAESFSIDDILAEDWEVVDD